MGNCMNPDKDAATTTSVNFNERPMLIVTNQESGHPVGDNDEDDVFSKSLQSPGHGLCSPKQRFARRTSAHKGVMSSIAMKFPHIRRSFVACKTVFERHALCCTDDNNNNNNNNEKNIQDKYISVEQVKAVLVDLGANSETLDREEISRIINTADLSGDDRIDFKEFLIAAAVGCFLSCEPEGQSPNFLRIRKGFEAAELAFGKIDKDGSGCIDFSELKTAFLSMKEDDFILERLNELDFNGDKAIEFPEFVWGLSAWVGMDELDDEEYSASPTPLNLEPASIEEN